MHSFYGWCGPIWAFCVELYLSPYPSEKRDVFLKLLSPLFMKLHFNTKGWHHPKNLRIFSFYDFHFFMCQLDAHCPYWLLFILIKFYNIFKFSIWYQMDTFWDLYISCFSFFLVNLLFLVHPSIILWLILKIKINGFFGCFLQLAKLQR